FGVEAALANAVQKRLQVAPPRHERRRNPSGDEEDVDDRHSLGRPVELVREDGERETGQAVAEAPDDGVDGRLRLELDLRGDRQVEKLDRGPCDQVTQKLLVS